MKELFGIPIRTAQPGQLPVRDVPVLGDFSQYIRLETVMEQRWPYRFITSQDLEALRMRIGINPRALHVEVAHQPQMYFDAAMWASRAVVAEKRTKIEVERIRAVVAQEIRVSPASFGIDKITEKAVEAAVELDKRVVERVNEWLGMMQETNDAIALRSAFDHRRDMVKEECRLYAGDYFSYTEGDAQATRDAIAAQRTEVDSGS